MLTAPMFELIPDPTRDTLRKMRDADLAVRAWRYKQEQRRKKQARKYDIKRVPT